MVEKNHSHIFPFMDALKREQAASELKVAQHDTAILPQQKKKKQEYGSGHRAVLNFLRAAGLLLKLE